MGLEIGVLHVRRSLFIRASPNRVWREFEETEKFAAWFGIGHTLHAFEPRVGARTEFSVEIDGVRRHYGGQVLVFEPEREASFTSQWHDPAMAWAVPTFWTLRLTALYDGTLAEIFHHGFERLGAEAANQLQGYEEGWDIKHLKALRAIVEA